MTCEFLKGMNLENTYYDPVCDWYEYRFVYTDENGVKRIQKAYVRYYWGESSIPKVRRKKIKRDIGILGWLIKLRR